MNVASAPTTHRLTARGWLLLGKMKKQMKQAAKAVTHQHSQHRPAIGSPHKHNSSSRTMDGRMDGYTTDGGLRHHWRHRFLVLLLVDAMMS